MLWNFKTNPLPFLLKGHKKESLVITSIIICKIFIDMHRGRSLWVIYFSRITESQKGGLLPWQFCLGNFCQCSKTGFPIFHISSSSLTSHMSYSSSVAIIFVLEHSWNLHSMKSSIMELYSCSLCCTLGHQIKVTDAICY